MSEIFVRVFAKNRVKDSDDQLPNVVFDLKIDEIAKTVSGGWLIFGMWGDYTEDSTDVDPIILHRDSRIDYGSSWDADRYGSCNIRDKEIQIGSYFSMTDTEGETHTFVITKVAVLGERLVD